MSDTIQTQTGLRTADYWFDLPQELIAQDPLEDRDLSRMLVMNRKTGQIEHKIFRDIIDYLDPGDTLVLNDTRVIPARLLGTKEGTGANAEILLLKRRTGDVWETLVRPGKKLRPGAWVSFGDGLLRAEILDTTPADLRAFAEDLDRALAAPAVCVFGSGEALAACELDTVENLVK